VKVDARDGARRAAGRRDSSRSRDAAPQLTVVAGSKPVGRLDDLAEVEVADIPLGQDGD
jgi:hypothetical protein